MEGCKVFDSCNDILNLLNSPNSSLWTPSASFQETNTTCGTPLSTGEESQSGHSHCATEAMNSGGESRHWKCQENMVNYDRELRQVGRENIKRNRWDGVFAPVGEGENTGGEEFDPNQCNQTEKKRRLTVEQVEFLEKSFVMENKLDAKRKAILAKQLGLQNKQVAIWFQNRRARYKTKYIEKEYDSLKASFDSLKYDYDSIAMEKKNLQNEVEILKEKLVQKENNSIPNNKDYHRKEVTPTKEIYGQVQKTGLLGELMIPGSKQLDDANSAKSDILDCESTYCTYDNLNSMQIEASSGLVGGPDQQCDLSPDDEEHFMMSRNLLLPQTPPTFNNFLKLEDDEGNYDPSDDLFWPWLY